MQIQPVYHYLTWVKQSFGSNAYNSLASNLEFTRTLKLNDWQLYGSSRLVAHNADITLTQHSMRISKFNQKKSLCGLFQQQFKKKIATFSIISISLFGCKTKDELKINMYVFYFNYGNKDGESKRGHLQLFIPFDKDDININDSDRVGLYRLNYAGKLITTKDTIHAFFAPQNYTEYVLRLNKSLSEIQSEKYVNLIIQLPDPYNYEGSLFQADSIFSESLHELHSFFYLNKSGIQSNKNLKNFKLISKYYFNSKLIEKSNNAFYQKRILPPLLNLLNN